MSPQTEGSKQFDKDCITDNLKEFGIKPDIREQINQQYVI